MISLLYRALRAQPGELAAVAWAFAYFFLLLCSYYILRPVRDALAVEAGTQTLQWLFTATFVAMIALVPVFGWLCARLPRARLLPVVYGFFTLNLIVFSSYMSAPVFFVWLSVFNLFAVSVFWSFMSDIFDTPQAARLYGAIAAGGSCGAIAGPLLAAVAASAAAVFVHQTVAIRAPAAVHLSALAAVLLLYWLGLWVWQRATGETLHLTGFRAA